MSKKVEKRGENMAKMTIRRERILDTFAFHKTRREEYSSELDTIMNFALETGYDIAMVREERKMRDLV